jgi:hypothetical protein
MGGQESLNANLNDPEAVSASVMIYASGFDKIDTKKLERLQSPVLVIAGGEDTGAKQAAVNFLSTMREAKRPCENSFIRVRTTVTHKHSSTKERTTIQKPFESRGFSSKIFSPIIWDAKAKAQNIELRYRP